MQTKNIILQWIYWQFYEMPKFLLQVWGNYIVFSANFFSVPLLLKTFLAPWHRYKWQYPRGLDVFEFFNTLISNIVSRFLGALMRIVLIVVGIFLQIFVVLAGLVIFVGWLAIPFIILVGFFYVFI